MIGWQLLVGLTLGALVGLVARWANALTRSGALAAALTGGVVFGFGGVPWAILLLTFFFSSSALSFAFATRKARHQEKFSKGARRDWGQVLANGGVAALLGIAHFFDPAGIWPWIAFSGALAAVTADTWATELGVLSPEPPRLITSGKPVVPGTSGGISLVGTGASLAGAGLIGGLASALQPLDGDPALFAAVSIAGLAGALFDSLLGATVQGIYTCPACRVDSEHHPLHRCGSRTVLTRGWAWLNNDLVNLGASLLGAVAALAIWAALRL